MPLMIELTRVEPIPPSDRLVVRHFLDSPALGPVEGSGPIPCRGWTIRAEDAPPLKLVRVADGYTHYAEGPIDRPRRDVRHAFPETDPERIWGFDFWINPRRLAERFAFQIQIVDGEGRDHPIARAEGTLQARDVPPTTQGLKPLAVTNLGRTGGTWLLHLLAQHPAIVGPPDFRAELRVFSYWMDLLQTLSEPRAILQSMDAVELVQGNPLWFCGGELESQPPNVIDPEFIPAFTPTYVDDLARFCRAAIDSVYAYQQREANKPEAVFCAEKILPGPTADALLRECPEARELVLVRDLRDMIASIFAFNAKRGYDGFNRGRCESDEAFIAGLRRGAGLTAQTLTSRSGRSKLVRYEDLVTDTPGTLRAILAWLGLPADEPTVSQVLADADRDRQAQQGHRTSSSAAASVGRWRDDLTTDQKRFARHYLDEFNVQFGYETTVIED